MSFNIKNSEPTDMWTSKHLNACVPEIERNRKKMVYTQINMRNQLCNWAFQELKS